ncbi:MAG: hypothetical protein PF693_00460 [Spirochaetia bacterium]|jgi:hypothetical protein|nr:hypothetical protein [Spirochaetia bacterium]
MKELTDLEFLVIDCAEEAFRDSDVNCPYGKILFWNNVKSINRLINRN